MCIIRRKAKKINSAVNCSKKYDRVDRSVYYYVTGSYLWYKSGIPAASLSSLSQHDPSQIKAVHIPKNNCKVLKWYNYTVISGTLFLFGAMKTLYMFQIP